MAESRRSGTSPARAGAIDTETDGDRQLKCQHRPPPLWGRNYGPTRAVYAYTASDPDRFAALDRAFLDVLTTWNRRGPGGPLRYGAKFQLVTARTRQAPATAPRRANAAPCSTTTRREDRR